MTMPGRLLVLVLGLMLTSLAVGCGQCIAVEPAASERPRAPVRDAEGGDAGSVDATDGDASVDASPDASVVDGRADASGGADRAAGDANSVDVARDTFDAALRIDLMRAVARNEQQ